MPISTGSSPSLQLSHSRGPLCLHVCLGAHRSSILRHVATPPSTPSIPVVVCMGGICVCVAATATLAAFREQLVTWEREKATVGSAPVAITSATTPPRR